MTQAVRSVRQISLHRRRGSCGSATHQCYRQTAQTKADVPIKWAFSDDSGAFLPPFASVTAVVTSPSGSATTYVAGEGVNAIRWALDTAGNATQYIANYTPSAVGTYKVEIYVNDVCGASTKQGGFTFYVAR